MNLSALSTPILGMPAWTLGIVVIGGVALAIFIRRRGSSSSGALGQNAAASSAPADPNIDPNTGVPYTIESQINPATGLPAYYGTPGVGNSPSATPTPTPTPAPAPPGPGANGPTPITPPAPVRTPSGPIPMSPAAAAAPSFQVVHAATWPTPDSALFSIWQDHARGIPFPQWEQQVLGMNPQITDPNKIYPNEPIRIPA